MSCRTRSAHRELPLGIEDKGIGALCRVGQIEPCIEQPFVEKPQSPRICTSRRRAHHVCDRYRTCFQKQGFQNRKVQSFIAQREGQVSGKVIVRLVARGVNVPRSSLIDFVAWTDR